MRKKKQTLSDYLGDYLDKKIQKYSSGDELWEENPVSVEEFVKSPDFLDWEDQVYPGVLEDLKEVFTFKERGVFKYNHIILLEGLGSGKSQFAAISFIYMVYMLLCLHSPQRFYQIAEDSRIQLVNCSPSGDQARRVVFDYVLGHVKRCTWFKKKEYIPDPNIESELRFPKNIYITPGSSTARTVLGSNLLLAVVDEMSFFDRTQTRDQAKELYDTLVGRMRSRFGSKFLFIGISSVRYVDDYISKLYDLLKVEEDAYVKRRAVWEAKPASFYSGKFFEFNVVNEANQVVEVLKIPIEYKREFELTPSLALRDLAARPSLTINPYFKEFDRVIASINRNRMNPLIETGNGYENPDLFTPLLAYKKLPDWFVGEEGVRYVIGLDLAKGARDRCGLALVHLKGYEEKVKYDEMGRSIKVKLPVVYVDLVTRFVAPVEGEIDFGEIREFINLLRIERKFNIDLIVSDTYQSLDFRQIMTKLGYSFEEFSVDRNRIAYDTLQSLIYDNRLDWYEHESLLYELRRLEDRVEKIEHSRYSGKDIADALAISCYFVVGDKLVKLRGDKPSLTRPKGVLAQGVFSPLSTSNTYNIKKYLP